MTTTLPLLAVAVYLSVLPSASVAVPKPLTTPVDESVMLGIGVWITGLAFAVCAGAAAANAVAGSPVDTTAADFAEVPPPPANSRREAAATAHNTGEFTNGPAGTPPTNDASTTAPETARTDPETTAAAGAASGASATGAGALAATAAAFTLLGAGGAVSSSLSSRTGRVVTDDFGAPVASFLADFAPADLRLCDEPADVVFTSLLDSPPVSADDGEVGSGAVDPDSDAPGAE
ncbi:MAG: hypothetical protein ACRDUB_03380, partial [Mycobacterium sp.]